MEDFAGRQVLVVGGGDTAIESALGLANQEGTTVTLSYRGEKFLRIKDRLQVKLDRAVRDGRIELILGSTVRMIRSDTVVLDTAAGVRIIPNDDVVVRIGGEAPVAFLEKMGVRLVQKEVPLVAGCGERVLGPRGRRSRCSSASPVTAPAQISPGPLSKPHKKLEGSLNCTKCHGLKKGAMNDACLSCHKEIGALIESGRGLHARDAKGSCAKCHPEHAGLDFDLVKWNEGSAEKFDHKRTGWELEQKHGETKCKDCHKTEFRKGEIADLSPRKTGAGWVGLETACLACHEDYHKKALGQNCTKCHDIAKWKPAPHFNHDSTTYPLTGKHADSIVTCAKCHEAKRLDPRGRQEGEGHSRLQAGVAQGLRGLPHRRAQGTVQGRLLQVPPDVRLAQHQDGRLRSRPDQVSAARQA